MIPGNLYIFVEDENHKYCKMNKKKCGWVQTKDEDVFELSTGNVFMYLEKASDTWGKFFSLETEQAMYGSDTLTPYLVPLNEEEFLTW